MAIITLLTDSGEADHYVAAIKARILSINPGIKIVDISHQIPSCDLAQGAFVLRAVFRDFPKGTVHLVGVHAIGHRGDLYIATQIEEHYFVGTDNGFFGLISDQAAQGVVNINSLNSLESTFPERDIMAVAATKIAGGMKLSELGKALPHFKRMTDRHVKATKKQIAGHVLRIDNYGNLMTNIPKEAFDVLSKNKNYSIQFGREVFRRINDNYNQVEPGEAVVLFNSLGFLEVAVNQGNAAELFNMVYDSAVVINFDE